MAEAASIQPSRIWYAFPCAHDSQTSSSHWAFSQGPWYILSCRASEWTPSGPWLCAWLSICSRWRRTFGAELYLRVGLVPVAFLCPHDIIPRSPRAGLVALTPSKGILSFAWETFGFHCFHHFVAFVEMPISRLRLNIWKLLCLLYLYFYPYLF